MIETLDKSLLDHNFERSSNKAIAARTSLAARGGGMTMVGARAAARAQLRSLVPGFDFNDPTGIINVTLIPRYRIHLQREKRNLGNIYFTGIIILNGQVMRSHHRNRGKAVTKVSTHHIAVE